MRKRLIIAILVSMSFLCLGCATEYNVATGKEEFIFITTPREVNMGRSMSQQVEQKYEPVDNPMIQLRISSVGHKIADVCDRQDLLYRFQAIEDDEVNAFALPGGYIYVTSALLEEISSDDELACILGHEVGHVVAKHSVKRIQAAMGYNLLSILIAGATKDKRAVRSADIAFTQILLGYSRQDELLADRLAITYAKRAGYDPQAMISFLQKLKQIQKERGLRALFYARTHPHLSERIAQARRIIHQKMEFQDYINRPE